MSIFGSDSLEQSIYDSIKYHDSKESIKSLLAVLTWVFEYGTECNEN